MGGWADVFRALEVAVGFFWGDLGVTLGFFRESGCFVHSKVFVTFINQWLNPIGPYPSAGIMRRASSQPRVDWSTMFSKRRKYHVYIFKCC